MTSYHERKFHVNAAVFTLAAVGAFLLRERVEQLAQGQDVTDLSLMFLVGLLALVPVTGKAGDLVARFPWGRRWLYGVSHLEGYWVLKTDSGDEQHPLSRKRLMKMSYHDGELLVRGHTITESGKAIQGTEQLLSAVGPYSAAGMAYTSHFEYSEQRGGKRVKGIAFGTFQGGVGESERPDEYGGQVLLIRGDGQPARILDQTAYRVSPARVRELKREARRLGKGAEYWKRLCILGEDDVEIGLATDADLESVVKMQGELIRDPGALSQDEGGGSGFLVYPTPLETLQRMVNDEGGLVVVARNGGHVIGFSIVHRLAAWTSNHPEWLKAAEDNGLFTNRSAEEGFYVQHIARDPKWRGLGAQLLGGTVEELQRRGGQYVVGDIAVEPVANFRSLSAHTARGFLPAHRYRDEHGVVWQVMVEDSLRAPAARQGPLPTDRVTA